jgi:hypothetical protein
MTVDRIGSAFFLLVLAGCAKPAPGSNSETTAESPAPVHPAGELIETHADALRQLSGVGEVEVLVAAAHPSHRIIHIRDWHLVPRDLYAIDLRQAAGRPLGDQEVADRYQELLREVDAVQQDQELILDALATRHGLRRVLVEGLTPEGVANYRAILAGFKGLEDRLAQLREGAVTPGGRAPDVDQQIEKMARDLREKTLEYGAAGRVWMRGLVDVLPLDDADLLDAANPVRADGTVRLDPARVEARHDGQVRRALARGPVAVLVLGGAHDLSASVRRVGGGATEYVRLTPKRYAGAAGGK